MTWYYFILWDRDWQGNWHYSATKGPLLLSNPEGAAWQMRQQTNDWKRDLEVYRWTGQQWVIVPSADDWGRGTTGT